ncbi:MAG TPA: UDP-N-acetylmuramoyl-tripeptide--D-alanyl-D-alanine ligase [Planctomycetota bacterium]|nr:UDP-N-acetylmuramoyl-tripeptide--D-alanyl-D-alanine ligase [Planctomycetota bacterium]
MFESTAGEVARMCGGRLETGEPSGPIRGVCVDSRRIAGGELFVALPGERFDGHDFVWRAFAAGAAGAMISSEIRIDQAPRGRALVRVGDTYGGLGRLAAEHRLGFGFPWVAITGSCGKSTTKELASLLLGMLGPVLKAEASFNNRVGVPLTLLDAGRQHRFAVVELGSNHKGELAPLAAMAAPDVAVVTCVAPAHLAGFGDLDGVAEEKSAILDGLRPGGLAVLNADDRYFDFFRRRARGPVVSFGLSEGAEVRATEVVLNPEGTEFLLPGGFRACLPLPGMHNVRNALAASAVAHRLGAGMAEIAERLAEARPLHMRSRLVRLGGVLLFEDCYNANPASFLAALEALDSLGERRKVVVAGDMGELGRNSEAHHRQLGEEIAGRGVGLLVTVGSESRLVYETASRSSARLESHHYQNAAAAAAAVPDMLRPGDAVLVKGSRVAGLEAVSQAIERRFAERKET